MQSTDRFRAKIWHRQLNRKVRMKNPDIAKRMARQSGVSRAEAADRVDRVVHQILSNLRQGRKSSLPGLGTFSLETAGRYSNARGRTAMRREISLAEAEVRHQQLRTWNNSPTW